MLVYFVYNIPTIESIVAYIHKLQLLNIHCIEL